MAQEMLKFDDNYKGATQMESKILDYGKCYVQSDFWNYKNNYKSACNTWRFENVKSLPLTSLSNYIYVKKDRNGLNHGFVQFKNGFMKEGLKRVCGGIWHKPTKKCTSLLKSWREVQRRKNCIFVREHGVMLASAVDDRTVSDRYTSLGYILPRKIVFSEIEFQELYLHSSNSFGVFYDQTRKCSKCTSLKLYCIHQELYIYFSSDQIEALLKCGIPSQYPIPPFLNC